MRTDAETILAGLRAAPLLSDAPAHAVRRLAARCLLRKVRRNATLYEQGSRPESVYVLLEGRIEVYGSGGRARRAVFDLLAAGDLAGLGAAFASGPHALGARALDDARLIEIPVPALIAEIRRSDGFSQTVLRALSRENERLQERLRSLRFDDTAQRLCRYLLALAGERPHSRSLQMPFEKRLVAEYLGMTPATLSRALLRLRGCGLAINGQRLTVQDWDRLRGFVNGDKARAEPPA